MRKNVEAADSDAFGSANFSGCRMRRDSCANASSVEMAEAKAQIFRKIVVEFGPCPATLFPSMRNASSVSKLGLALHRSAHGAMKI